VLDISITFSNYQSGNIGIFKDTPQIQYAISGYTEEGKNVYVTAYLDKNVNWAAAYFYDESYYFPPKRDNYNTGAVNLKGSSFIYPTNIWDTLADGWHVITICFDGQYSNFLFAKNAPSGIAPDMTQVNQDVYDALHSGSKMAISPESKNFGTQSQLFKATSKVTGGVPFSGGGEADYYQSELYIDRVLFDSTYTFQKGINQQWFITAEKWDSLSPGWHTYTLVCIDSQGRRAVANYVFSKGATSAPVPPLDAGDPKQPGGVSSISGGSVSAAGKSYAYDIYATGKWSAVNYIDGIQHDTCTGNDTTRHVSDLSNVWDSLPYGSHTFRTVATGENGIAYEQTWNFLRSNYVSGITGTFDEPTKQVRYCVDATGKWVADVLLNGVKIDSISGVGQSCFIRDFSSIWNSMSGGNYSFTVQATGEDGVQTSTDIVFTRPSVSGFRSVDDNSGYRYSGSYGGGSTYTQSGYGWSTRWDTGNCPSADLGIHNSPPDISYVFNSDERYSVTTRVDGQIIGTGSTQQGKYTGSVDWGNTWDALHPGQHTIEVTGTTTSGQTQTVIWQVDKPTVPPEQDKTCRVIPKSCDVGTLGQQRYYIAYRVSGIGTYQRVHTLDKNTRLTAQNQKAGDYVYDERNASGANTG